MKRVALFVLLTAATLFAQGDNVTTLLPSTSEVLDSGAFYISGNDGIWATCKKSTLEGIYLVAVSDCELQSGHSLDEVMTAMVKQSSDNAKSFNETRMEYEKLGLLYITILKICQRELNHGIPLKKGGPNT